MSKYRVNDEEVSTKKEATEVAFEAVAAGEEVVLAPAEPEPEPEVEAKEEAPVKANQRSRYIHSITGGPPVIL